MGLEIVVGAFTLLSMTFGLVLPVVGWALWMDRERKLLVAGLQRGEALRVTEVEAGDAAVPVRLSLSTGEHEVAVRAVTRGTQHLWQFEVARAHVVEGPRIAVIEESWLPASREGRTLGAAEAPLAVAQRGYRLHTDDEPAAVRLLREPAVFEALLGALGREPLAREVVVAPEALRLEVGREGLDPEQALVWLTQLLILLDALDGGRAAMRLFPSGGAATGVGGGAACVPGVGAGRLSERRRGRLRRRPPAA